MFSYSKSLNVMPQDKIESFVAYASQPPQSVHLIQKAVEKANQKYGGGYKRWEENDVSGRPLTAPIFEGLSEANLLVADVTTLNFNVTFETLNAFQVFQRGHQ